MSPRRTVPALALVPTSAGHEHERVALRTPPLPLAGVMDAAAAARLTKHIRDAWNDIGSQIARLRELVEEARTGEAWRTLGFSSWTAYVRDVLPPLCLPREQRREVVAWLTGTGMSTRAIAPIVGADQKTIVNDRRAFAAGCGATEEGSSVAPLIIGLNGHTYGATATQRPTLSAIRDQAPAPRQLGMPASAAGHEILLTLLRKHLEGGQPIDVETWNLHLERARFLEAAEIADVAGN